MVLRPDEAEGFDAEKGGPADLQFGEPEFLGCVSSTRERCCNGCGSITWRPYLVSS